MSENAKSLIFKIDGKLERAYDGDYAYYERTWFIDKCGRIYDGIRRIQPPFYNHTKHLCEYLLAPNDKMTVTMDDEGDTWLVKAEVREWQQVCSYDEMQPGALKSLAERKNIRFPLAMDNGRFYTHFFPSSHLW